MSGIQGHVRIARRFQRSIRIDTDLREADAIEGFLCPPSSADVLTSMARHISQTGHAAFTWTGPYGSGKSSLVVALCAALAGKRKIRDAAVRALDKNTVATLTAALPPKVQGWRVLPIVGRRAPLAQLIGESLEANGFAKRSVKPWTDAAVLQNVAALAADEPRVHGGLAIIIDEMGKALEGAAHDGHDIFLLQQLAELAARSERRLVVVGILHQAFDEYAQRLAREVRDEWAKVQGRFVDLVVNASGEEQLELLSRAIENTGDVQPPRDAIAAVADLRAAKPAANKRLLELLEKCWPLHPVVATLLGPLSRRRFGQNQRSLFAFLNSAEAHGFQDFLADATKVDLYTPDRLWDYLRINLEPAILASPDGHRWAIGVDALERSASAQATALEQSLMRTIIVIDLFRERSGLMATPALLFHCAPAGTTRRDVEMALKSLAKRSCIAFRHHVGAYTLFAGSDFDIDDALAAALPNADAVDLGRLHDLAGLQRVLAKRHYHDTGAIRWFNLDMVRVNDLGTVVEHKSKSHGAAGRFLIAIPTHGENPGKAKKFCRGLAATAPPHVVIGISDHAWHVVQLAREFKALSTIHDERPELRGDAIARREIVARLSETQARLENELQRMTEATLWFRAEAEPTRLSASALNALASDISDRQFNKAPRIINELLNRDLPSSNAVKAQRDLLKRMLDSAGKVRLGLEGWPAEAGLMESILITTGLYREESKGVWAFGAPNAKSRLGPVWQDAIKELKAQSKTSVSLSDIYERWRRPPFGVKDGIMPIIALAIYVTNREAIAVYRNGVFQPEMSDLDVDLLTSDPSHIHFRWMNLSGTAQDILRGLSKLAVQIDPCSRASSGKPLDVARSLVAAFDQLPPWTKRTAKLSPIAKRLAEMLRYAADPNRLLFDDVPSLSESKTGKSALSVFKMVGLVETAFGDLRSTYPDMLGELKTLMLAELEAWQQKLGDLRDRAINLRKVTGDLRLEAFINRLANYNGTDGDIEGIASLAIGKNPVDWVDADFDRARGGISELAQAFKRHEEIGRVFGRSDTRHRMAVIVPREDGPRAMHTEFVVNAHDKDDVNKLIAKIDEAVGRSSKNRQNIVLAALAQVSARYMDPSHPVAPAKRGTGR